MDTRNEKQEQLLKITDQNGAQYYSGNLHGCVLTLILFVV